jgi:hypothetical protein
LAARQSNDRSFDYQAESEGPRVAVEDLVSDFVKAANVLIDT